MTADKPALYVDRVDLREDLERNPEEYPFNLPVIRKFKGMRFKKPVTFIIGENGVGKSTLLEAFAATYGFNPEGGSRNFNFATRESHSSFYKYLRVVKTTGRARDGFFLRAESFYNLASNIDELDEAPAPTPPIIDSYGGVSLHKQSHGESFLALLNNRLGGNGLYIFDEPESALSPTRLMSALVRIDDLVKKNSQFIISTHSPILMAYPNADIYEITDGALTLTKLEDTNHFSISKYFFMNPQRILHELLDEEGAEEPPAKSKHELPDKKGAERHPAKSKSELIQDYIDETKKYLREL